MARFLVVMLLIGGSMACAIAWSVVQPSSGSATTAMVVSVVGIAGIASGAFRLLWSPALAAYPPREPAPDAVRRRFQSFGLGLVNMGLSIHVAADDGYLHLTPLLPWRMLGARGASIPWSAMKPVGKRVVRLDGHRLDGPSWCLDLASPSPD